MPDFGLAFFSLHKVFASLQLFWEKKLSGLNVYDIAEELMKNMDLPKGLQGKELVRRRISCTDA